MRERFEKTLLQMIRDHNRLNGFRFVIIEFSLVTLAVLFISLGGVLHGEWPVALIGAGIAANAAAVIAIAVAQIRDHEESEGLLKLRLSQYRADIGRKYPHLSSHTVIFLVSILIPLLLVALLYVQRLRPLPK
jgi:hypothetical protein